MQRIPQSEIVHHLRGCGSLVHEHDRFLGAMVRQAVTYLYEVYKGRPQGFSVKFLRITLRPEDASRSEGTGMVWENGLFVYRTGRPLPLRVVDDAIRLVPAETAQHTLLQLACTCSSAHT